MKNKKIIIASVLLLVIVSLWLLTTGKKQKEGSSVTYVTPAPILPSVMPKDLTERKILYTGEPPFEFPRRVPFVSVVGRRDFRGEVARLFALVGVTTQPQIIMGS